MKAAYKITPTRHGWGYGYGFFSNYRICLEQLMIFDQRNENLLFPYIDWSGTTFVEGFNPFKNTVIEHDYNPFNDWFEQTMPAEEIKIIECNIPSNPEILDHAKHYFDETQKLKWQQIIDRKYIKPKQFLIDRVEDIWKNKLSGHVVLGVMARGTEYNLHHPMYGIFDVTDYIAEIKKILRSNNHITKLFIVSEDQDYVDKISSAFPDSYYIEDVFRRTDETDEYINTVHCWPNVSTKRKNHCKLLGEETITQAKLLGKCDYLLGRMSGVFAGSILWNTNLKQVFKL